ncbi:MAG: DUF1080 domain-containing protein [Prolixibacteraceae bacterium]|jgi:hypothetical protein|nr:DUF1080 domain-containing protein [Prolixibacteraceae bacterium]
MKNILVVALLFVAFSCFAQKKESLFNGKDLKGWTIFVNDPSIVPEQFFYVRNGVIETPGVPMGYLRTKKEYSNYHLHVEWCYPEKPTNSGVFVHTNGPDQLWPAHYQCQLKSGCAGDFIVNAVYEKATVHDSIYVGTEKVKPIAVKFSPSNEKKVGDWNSYDIYCYESKVHIVVNGMVQNNVFNCSMTKGSIGLQAEGSTIRFRNIWIEKLNEKNPVFF